MVASFFSTRMALVACALVFAAGCADSTRSVTDPGDDQQALLAMAEASVEEAERLYALSDTAQQAGQWNRAMLLWAAVDGLQFGAQMHSLTINVDGTPTAFTGILQEAVLVDSGTHVATARALIAWSGARAERIMVAYQQVDGDGSDILMFLDGGDSLYFNMTDAQSIDLSARGAGCVYDQKTPLVGPEGDCTYSTMSGIVGSTAYMNGDTNAASRALSISTTSLAGISVSRELSSMD